MSEWIETEETRDRGWTLRVGPLRAVIREIERDCFVWGIEHVPSKNGFSEPPGASSSDTLDEAKSAAEQALREMHDALAAHFAPVLRWRTFTSNGFEQDEAVLGYWSLIARDGVWRVGLADVGMIRDVSVAGSTRENNRRAAEAALRALGVPFRVEGES